MRLSLKKFLKTNFIISLIGLTERIHIITERYDSSIYWCGSALEYSEEKSKLWSKLCADLVTFNFIWGSVESLTLKFVTKKVEDSTTYLARKYIGKNYKGPTIKGYIDAFNSLYKTLGKELLNQDLIYIDKDPLSTKGLFLVSKLRNQFAHGSRIIPETDGWSDEMTGEIEIIQLSSRILLYTIQMLLIAKYGSKGHTIEIPNLFDFTLLEDSVSLDALIKNLHFEDYVERITIDP